MTLTFIPTIAYQVIQDNKMWNKKTIDDNIEDFNVDVATSNIAFLPSILTF